MLYHQLHTYQHLLVVCFLNAGFLDVAFTVTSLPFTILQEMILIMYDLQIIKIFYTFTKKKKKTSHIEVTSEYNLLVKFKPT